MRFIVALLISGLISGCLTYQPDQRVVGRFRASSGEVIDIHPDGRIVYVKENKEVLVGLVTIERNAPLAIQVIAPDTSPLVGTKIVFSADGKAIEVEWQNAIGGAPKPTVFQKE